MYRFDEYEPMRVVLRIAVERKQIDREGLIKTVVRDAQIVRLHPDRARTIERSTYRYSVALGRSRETFLDRMSPERLSEQDVRQLLDFFNKVR